MALLYRCFVLGDPHAQAFPVRVAHDPHAPVLVGDLKSQIATERGWSVPGFDPRHISVYAAAGAPRANVAARREHEFGVPLDGLDELPPPSTTANGIDFVVTKPAAPTAPGADYAILALWAMCCCKATPFISHPTTLPNTCSE
eukprot:TRINITY_DN12056_c0_g1_i1.p2 TRINITY_DN12056_c0_g1~~TRINITY_DN12056_c0_g1_i1.p2  ORF type:complete len:143 (-),score=16.25 TRINITY_DN12056_c0_g1_i1:845-1273(-)